MKTKHLVLPGAIALFVGIFAYHFSTQAAPPLLPFQGRLTDAHGNVVADGARVVQFKIYDAPVGGSAVWNGEVQKLTVNAGLVSTLLGTKASLSSVDFDRALYLELTVDANNDNLITAADPPLLPRQSILPAVFAREAADSRLLDGHDWSALFGTNNPATGTLLDSKIADGSIQASKIRTQSIVGGVNGQIALNTISSANIANGSINSSDIRSNSLTLATLAKEVLDQLVPAGTIIAFGGPTNKVPDGWLLCNGRPVSHLQYPNLYAAISNSWGSGVPNSANAFNLPDLRGMFLRGVNMGRSDGYGDQDAAMRTNSVPVGGPNTGGRISGNAGDAVGSLQASTLPNHLHRWGFSTAGDEFTRQLKSWNVSGTERIVLRDFGQQHLPSSLNIENDNFKEVTPNDDNGVSLYTDRSTGQVLTGGQVAPPNAYVHYIIKY